MVEERVEPVVETLDAAAEHQTTLAACNALTYSVPLSLAQSFPDRSLVVRAPSAGAILSADSSRAENVKRFELSTIPDQVALIREIAQAKPLDINVPLKAIPGAGFTGSEGGIQDERCACGSRSRAVLPER